MTSNSLHRAIEGCLLGTAVGDALGLPFEGMSRTRLHRFWKDPTRHHFLFGRGMLSDDTEHAIMVAQSLVESGDDVPMFQKRLARRLRLWFLGLPAGIGLGTLRSLLKLTLGFPPCKSGVFSAGNGPAMRSPLLGIIAGEDRELLKSLVKASTIITHTDPKAEWGALAVALAASFSRKENPPTPEEYLDELTPLLPKEAWELLELVRGVRESVESGESTEKYAEKMGWSKGVSGYMYHTVPAVLHAWLSHPDDFEQAMLSILRCGGDTDTTGAILGGISGGRAGWHKMPSGWREGLWDFPRNTDWMLQLSQQLSQSRESNTPTGALRLSPWKIALRNILFTTVVLGHGFRRLLPPY